MIRFEYPLYFRQLYRQYGMRALVRQFRFAYRRPFSRGLIRRFAPRGRGIEIGVGSFTIAPVRRTLLTDGFHAHAESRSMAQKLCKADQVPVADNELEFVLSEHVLEHLADPIAALLEWKRILRVGGKVFLFLPHKDRTFDRSRPRTTLAHLIADHETRVSDGDRTHLEEWRRLVIEAGRAEHYRSTPIERHAELGLIHHHVWVTDDVVELLEHLGFQVIFREDQVPDRQDSFVVVAQKGL